MTQLPPIIVCTLVRNGGAGLARSLGTVQRLMSASEKSYCIVVTNDNTDGTIEHLQHWKGTSSSIELQILDGLAKAYPNRSDRLAVARNFYLKSVHDVSLREFEFVCILDLDGLNDGVTAEHVASAMSLSNHWDGLFANQRGPYYDLYALRHPSWCPADVWHEIKHAARSPFRKMRGRRAIRRFIHD